MYIHFNTLKKKALKKHCGKSEIVQNEPFHPFPQCFLWNLYLKITLTHYQTTNFRLFQTERVCRRQFQI